METMEESEEDERAASDDCGGGGDMIVVVPGWRDEGCACLGGNLLILKGKRVG